MVPSAACAGIDTATGSKVEIQRPANLDAAIQGLGLEHALGSLRLMQFTHPATAPTNENVNVANLPAGTAGDSSDRQEEAAVTQGGQSNDGNSSPWLPLQLQLGLPLAPAELCDLVCR